MPVSFGWRVIKGQRWKEWRMKRGRWREAVGKIDGRPVFIDINMVCPPLCQFLAAISERHVSLHGHVKANDNVMENGGRLCDNRAPHPLSRYFSYLLLRLFSHSLSLPYFFFFFISFTSCFSVYFFLLFSFLSLSLYLSRRLVVLFLPPWKYYGGETASWRNRTREQRGA